MPYFNFRGAPVHYVEHGVGPALLLIHGAGGNAMNWSPELRRLEGYMVSAIDLPGHGKSIDAPPLASIAEFAELVLVWADAIEARTFAVVGQSMGVGIALQVALDAPKRVTHLVAVAGAARFDVNPALLNALRDGDDTVYTTLTRLSYTRDTPAEQLAQYESHLRKTSPEVLRAAFHACSTFDVSSRLHEIQIPAGVLCDSRDPMIDLQRVVDLSMGIRGSEINLILGVGHMIHIEAPEVVEMVVADILEKQSSNFEQ